jgi:hypothetical protein
MIDLIVSASSSSTAKYIHSTIESIDFLFLWLLFFLRSSRGASSS